MSVVNLLILEHSGDYNLDGAANDHPNYLGSSISALGAALIVRNPTVDGCALAHVVKCQRRQGENETYRKTNQQDFSHGRFFSPFEWSVAAPRRKPNEEDLVRRNPSDPRSIVR